MADNGNSNNDENGSESNSSGIWKDIDVVGKDRSDKDEEFGPESDLENELDGECNKDDNKLGMMNGFGFATLWHEYNNNFSSS